METEFHFARIVTANGNFLYSARDLEVIPGTRTLGFRNVAIGPNERCADVFCLSTARAMLMLLEPTYPACRLEPASFEEWIEATNGEQVTNGCHPTQKIHG